LVGVACVLLLVVAILSLFTSTKSQVALAAAHRNVALQAVRLPAGTGDASASRRAFAVSFLAQLRSDAAPRCLESWARSVGLVVEWSTGDSWVSLNGPPAAVDRGLGVSIDSHLSATGRIVWAANHPAELPTGVCGELAGIGVLHSFVRPSALGDVILGASSPGLSPSQLLDAYDADPLISRGIAGQGETVVLFETDAFNSSDVNEFANAVDRPLNLKYPLGNLGDTEGESTMDIETVHEIAPFAKLVDVNLLSSQFQNMSTAATYEAAFSFAAHRFPGAIWSISLGSCEDDTNIFDSADLMAMNDAVAKAEMGGTTVFSSSGDSGGLDCMPPDDAGQSPLGSWEGVSVPASLPAVTSVGGTTLSTTAAGTYLGERTWTEPLLLQGSGGGLSRVFPRPAWQVGPGTGGIADLSGARQVPDVSADANPATGNDIIEHGHVTTGGGTSLASPTWAGFTALIDEYLHTQGDKEVGFLNAELYKLAEAPKPYRPFHDITTGGNDYYLATPGYDMATGLGSPDVWNLARDLAAAGR
jgi:kumamolisin